MSKKVTESDLELIQLGKSLGLDLVSFADLRASQEDKFVDEPHPIEFKLSIRITDVNISRFLIFKPGISP